jgi:hypothetical protein
LYILIFTFLDETTTDSDLNSNKHYRIQSLLKFLLNQIVICYCCF